MIYETVNDISLLLLVTRESLNLYASHVSLIIGPLLLKANKKNLLWILGGTSGCLITVLIDEIHKTGPVDSVLILEKDTIFHYLSDHGFYKRNHCVLVTGRGQADMTRMFFLKKLKDVLREVCFYCLVDANLSDAQIFSTYRFGSKNKAYDNLFMTMSDLEFIRMRLSDVEKKHLTPFTDHADHCSRICCIRNMWIPRNLSETIFLNAR